MSFATPYSTATVPESLQDILIPFKKEMSELEQVLFSLLDSRVPFVKSVSEYVLRNGGKRLRPLLTVICAKMSGCAGESAYHMAACMEFIHTASLLHDDVVDNARVRRGRASANARWGNHVSVLVGDFFYCRASQLLTEQGDLKILKLVTDSITALTEGEVLEIVTNSSFKTTQNDYLSIITNKTARLFAAASQTGGVLGGVSPEHEQALENYGLNLGLAFQLVDDVLDYTASEDILGKAGGADLQEGKLTLPLILAQGEAPNEERQIIKDALLCDKLEPETFKKIKALIRKYRGFEKTMELAQGFVGSAKESLAPFRSSIEKDVLLTVADYVVLRDR